MKDLPDYPSLQRLAKALWRDGSVRGAAVMVGAGFTRHALRPGVDTREPPLWETLRKDLVAELYPSNESKAPTSPLRIAEEYRTTYGQAALDDFIRTRFPEKAWLPSPLHLQLLNLPWSDVLTTNWDTVLERACESVTDYNYEVVRYEADLTYARHARIVKLHGTIGDSSPLVFAEEDYRTYPAKHAAFVNFARQVFIENELCLIGFSGDDPNFLQWAGWVRDHLGATARRIYLAGHLALSPATRRYFEAHNISPIDLAPILTGVPPHRRHAEAARLFFGVLRTAQPIARHNWPLTPFNAFPASKGGIELAERVRKEPAYAISVLEETADLLRKDRLSYPGWLVCPRHLRQQLQYGGSEQWLWRKDVFDAIAPARRAEILYELVWRRTIGFLPLEEPLEKAVKGFLSVDLPDVDTALSAELALGLMRDARVSNNADAVTLWSQYIEKKTEAGSQLRLAARYQLCLFARDLLDFALLSKLTEDLASDEPEWRLRRAALLSETGQFVKAIKLMRDAADDLEKRARLDRTSLWIKSRLGWADWLSRAVDAAHFNRRENPARERDFRDSQIDPFEEIEQIGTASAREEEGMRNDAVDVMPLFEAGHYKDGGRRRARGDGVLNRYEADQLIEAVGLPIRIGSMSLCGSMAISTAETSYRPTADWYGWLLRSLHSHYDDAFNIYFGRLAIARLSKEVAETLVSVCNTAVDFWLERFRSARVPDERDDFGHALDQLRLYIMALAHLTPRMSIVEAISAYRKGVALARVEDLRHHWLIEAIGNLLSYAAQSVPKSRRGELALDAMEFPLASEKGVQPQLWPKVATSLWGSIPRRLDNPRWRSRIDQLIEATRSSQSREDAILRLTYLAERGGLQEDERLAFGDALWSKLDAGANPLPVESGLLESTFLELPAPAGVDVQARVQARVVNANLEEILALPKPLSAAVLSDKPNQLLALQNTKALGLSIGSQRATQLFDQLTSWSPTAGQRDDPFSSSMIRGFNDRLRQTIGDILAHVVVPEMAASDRTDARGHTLIDFVTRNHAWRALPGLPHFVASVASLENNVVAILRRAIWGGDHQQVGSAASAVAIWSKLADGGLFSRQVPRALIDAILAAIEARPAQGLQTLLYAADKLIATRFLLEADMYRLMTALIPLRDDLCYDSIPERSMRAVSVSLVRAQCVELARALQKRIPDEGILAVWIADGADDPLPEVRFASMTEEQT